MFTGLVQHVGRIATAESHPGGRRLSVDVAGWDHQPAPGASIAVNGCCLTVAGRTDHNELQFDVIRQTLEATTLGSLAADDRVNLEHAATPTTMLGGHIVQGHVDGIGRVARSVQREAEHRLWVEPPNDLLDCIVETGSIAMNGVSLTVAELTEGGFGVALIPTTLRETNLGDLAEGDQVNLETDCIAKTVVHWLRRQEHKA